MASFLVEVSQGADGLWRVDMPEITVFTGDLVVWVSRSGSPFQLVMWSSTSDSSPDFAAFDAATVGDVKEGLPPPGQAIAMTSGTVQWQLLPWRVPDLPVDIVYAVRAVASTPPSPGIVTGILRIEGVVTTGAGGGVSPPRKSIQPK